MDQEKKNREKLKKKLKEKSKKVAELCYEGKYQECLEYISTLADNAMCNFKIYEGAIHSLTHTKRYEEALALIEGHEVHGHSKTSFSFSTCLSEAVCNFELTRHLKAYHMFKDLLGHKDMDDDTRQYCTSCVKMILQTSGAEIEESITQLADELIRESKGDKHSSSSTSNIDPPVAADNPSSSLTSNVSTSATIVKSIAVVVESSSLPIVDKKSKEKGVVKEVNEIEEGEEDKTVEIEGDLNIKSIDINCCITHHCSGVLYEGTTSSRIFSSQRSFIEARSSQVDNIAELIEIGSNSRFIVTIDHLIDGPELTPMLVAEPIRSVTSFFKVESDSFLSENFLDDGSRQRWWTRISESFMCIFGDIIHGIIYLHLLGHICGDVANHIYVSAKGEGKILPLMDKSRTENYDVQNLIKKMKEIITLPFPEIEVQETYRLPDELTHLLGFVTADKLRYIPLYLLVNHPYFWSSQERIKFLKDLKSLIKQRVITYQDINKLLETHSSFKCQDPYSIDWRKMIDDSVCQGFFKHIYDRPKSLADVKEYYSDRPCEIVRYGTNCYNHANDYYYSKLRTSQVFYSEIEIEAHLRSFFPMVYVDLYVVLVQFIIDTGLSETRIRKALENSPISYFVPTINDQVYC